MYPATSVLDPQARDFYVRSLTLLQDHNVRFLVGGAYAYARYTGIERHTKDFDLFLRRADYDQAARVLREAGYETELSFPHWLGKAFKGEEFIDLIFSSGNRIAEVDDQWFEFAIPDQVFGIHVGLIPAEEMIWSKGLIMERERYDGADVAHLLHSWAERLDWRRLLNRFGKHWRPLLAHLVLFGFIYPFERSKIPAWVMEELSRRLAEETSQPDGREKICYGTIVSRQQFLKDVHDWGYKDARLQPLGPMTAEEIAHWTAGIAQDGAK